MDSAPQMEILDSTSLYRTEVHGAFPLDAQIYRVVFRPSSRQGFKNISVRSSKLFCLLKTLMFLYSSGPLMLQISAHKAMDKYRGLSQMPPCTPRVSVYSRKSTEICFHTLLRLRNSVNVQARSKLFAHLLAHRWCARRNLVRGLYVCS